MSIGEDLPSIAETNESSNASGDVSCYGEVHISMSTSEIEVSDVYLILLSSVKKKSILV